MKNPRQDKEQTPSLNDLNLSIARANSNLKLIGGLLKILLLSLPAWGLYFMLLHKLNDQTMISGVVLLLISGAMPIMLSKNLAIIAKLILTPLYFAVSLFIMFFVMLMTVGSA